MTWLHFMVKKKGKKDLKRKKPFTPRIKLNSKNVQWPLAEAEDSACIRINSLTYLLFRK